MKLDDLYLNGIDNLLDSPTKVVNQQLLLHFQNGTTRNVDVEVKYFRNSIKSIAGHYIISYARNGLKTDKGIQVGDSESELLEAYENLTSGRDAYCFKYELRPNGARFPIVVEIVFQVKNGRITKMMISDGGEHAWEAYCEVVNSEF